MWRGNMWTMNVGETRELQEQGNSEYVVYSMHSVQYVPFFFEVGLSISKSIIWGLCRIYLVINTDFTN